ncbi:MAG: hypothetical protein AB7H80_09665 [Candidatus Kapaibacterium sp.]
MYEQWRKAFWLSRPFRAGHSNSECFPWGAACGFPHGHAAMLPSGAARCLLVSYVKIMSAHQRELPRQSYIKEDPLL